MAVRGAIAGAPRRVGQTVASEKDREPRTRLQDQRLTLAAEDGRTISRPCENPRKRRVRLPWGRCRCIGRKVRRQAVHGSDRRHPRAFSVARSSCSAAIVSARLCSNGIFGVQPSSRLTLALDATLSLHSEATVSCVVKMRGAPSVLALNHSNRDRSAAFASTAPISGVPHPTPCVHWEGSL